MICVRYEGKASVLVKRANGSAVAVLRMLASDFSSYRDGRMFAGKFVWFLKRAQIFVADLWAAFEGEVFQTKEKRNHSSKRKRALVDSMTLIV